MVDPVSGSGAVQGLSQVQQREQKQADRQEAVRTSSLERKDEVQISEAAISQQQAEEAAERAREQLAASKESLGLDPGFDREA